jgi:hypothetical protein
MQLAAPIHSANATFDRYADALMSLPGVVSVGWTKAHGDEITLSVQDAELAYLADSVLADTIEGSRIVIESRDGSTDVPADSWVRLSSNVVRAMNALPGVVGWKRFGGYTLLADTHERAEWLKPLLTPTLAGEAVRVMTADELP